MTANEIFGNDSINVFTDASILTKGNSMIGCAGFCTVHNNQFINKNAMIVPKTNSARAELVAIYMGLEELLLYKKSNMILRLFSDSQLSILGIRDRIFNWMNNNRNKLLTNQSTDVKNQDLIISIINIIIENNINVEFYHQKGHINYKSDKELLIAKTVFRKSNNIDINDMDFFRKISYANDIVDKYTKYILRTNINTDVSFPVSFLYKKFDSNVYKNLVNNFSIC